MIQPDDDFDDDFEDADPVAEAAEKTLQAADARPDLKLRDTRRRIEDLMEQRKFRQEFDDLDF